MLEIVCLPSSLNEHKTVLPMKFCRLPLTQIFIWLKEAAQQQTNITMARMLQFHAPRGIRPHTVFLQN